jgi:hypothetical protein
MKDRKREGRTPMVVKEEERYWIGRLMKIAKNPISAMKLAEG